MNIFGRVGAVALAGAAAFVISTSGAMATTSIPGLFNTGVDGSGTPLSGHVADPHWTLSGSGVGPDAFTGGTNGSFPIGPWVPDDSSSRWITPHVDAADSFDPGSDGLYTYSLHFNMASTAGAFFSAQFAADNEASVITLNGHTLLTNDGGFNHWTGFSATDSSFFTVGDNELDIVVRNFAQDGGNPTGLDVQFLRSGGGGAAPEPASWLMLILGFGGLGTLLRSRRGFAFAA
jgi:hypothetical protein